MKAETIITRSIIAWIKKQGGDAFHVHGNLFQRKGEPDICGELLIDGVWKHLKIEVKTPEGRPTALQLKRIRDYTIRGYIAGVVTSIEDVQQLINRNQT